MNNGKYKGYLTHTITKLKEQAKKMKKDIDLPNDCLKEFAEGAIMGYYSIFSLLKHQAFVFCMDQKELGLADIKPDEDLLDLHRNPEVDFGEDNWTIDEMNEEKVKGYLIDSIRILKEQFLGEKKDLLKEAKDYNKGSTMAYHSAFSLLKHEARHYNIDQNEIGLTDVDL